MVGMDIIMITLKGIVEATVVEEEVGFESLLLMFLE